MARPGPSSLNTLLSSLRSPIFQTSHNPIPSSRTALKYLKRRLRGPSMLQYYPQSAFPSLKQLNSEGAWNKYAGWKGDGAVAVGVGANSKVLTGPDVVERGWTEVERRWEVRKKVDPETKEVEETWREAGWLEDDYERQRVAKVAFRRLLGKGPPKKGQGRRSQMKKR